jgi:hypothetical protein
MRVQFPNLFIFRRAPFLAELVLSAACMFLFKHALFLVINKVEQHCSNFLRLIALNCVIYEQSGIHLIRKRAYFD